MAARHGICVILLLVSAARIAQGHPGYFARDASTCTDQPALGSRYGRHGAVATDRTTTFTVIDASSNATATAVCPGGTYAVQVAFSSSREALVTVPLGTSSSSCSNRWYTSSDSEQPSLGLTWTAACSLSGTADIVVTSTTSSSAALQQAKLTLPMQASCAAASCASNANSPSSLVYGTPAAVGSGDSAAPTGEAGDDSEEEESSNEEALTIAHGALMLVAFVVLMPAAVIMARHKWLYGDKEAGKIKPGWFLLHVRIQLLAIACAVASFIIIYVVAGTDSGPELFTAHRALGIIAVALAVLQIAIGMARPVIKSPKRPAWRGGHYAVGYTSMLCGITNCFLGLVLIHEDLEHRLAYWLGPTLALSIFWLLLAVGLEVKKHKLQADDVYNPATHNYHGAGLPATTSQVALVTAGGAAGVASDAAGGSGSSRGPAHMPEAQVVQSAGHLNKM